MRQNNVGGSSESIGVYRHKSCWFYCQRERRTRLAAIGRRRRKREDYGYKKVMDTVDVLVMGRNTHEKVSTLFPDSPHVEPNIST